MKSSKKHRKFNFVTLFIILCMSIGFAILTATINIDGITNLFGNSWNIYLENIKVTEGSVEADLPVISNKTTVDYQVNLSKPGQFYSFTIDAVNDGTIDALVGLVENTAIDEQTARTFNYSITYKDGTPINQEDLLPANQRLTYKISLEYKEEILESDLFVGDTNINLSFTLVYNLPTGSTVKETPFTKLVKDSALSDSEINFNSASSSTNGQGLYVLSSSLREDYPIYYYRGNVRNNYAKFAGFCWRIVRTTETGGVKLIYNGTPSANGQCTNTTGELTRIGLSPYNSKTDSLAYGGYMYGDIYTTSTTSSSIKYGNSFTYSNGIYTLLSTKSSFDSSHHYTCLSSETTCEILYYASTATEVTSLLVGKGIEETIHQMEKNTTSSEIKVIMDNWFSNVFIKYFTNKNLDYNNYLEDTAWCNDRSVRADFLFNAYGGNSSITSFNSYYRIASGAPDLTCIKKNDRFTVNDIVHGNGALTYPVGLLTADEIVLAGAKSGTDNSSYYLYTAYDWWTISPAGFGSHSLTIMDVGSTGALNYAAANNSYGIRPTISLTPNVKIKNGTDGTSANPYDFLVD